MKRRSSFHLRPATGMIRSRPSTSQSSCTSIRPAHRDEAGLSHGPGPAKQGSNALGWRPAGSVCRRWPERGVQEASKVSNFGRSQDGELHGHLLGAYCLLDRGREKSTENTGRTGCMAAPSAGNLRAIVSVGTTPSSGPSSQVLYSPRRDPTPLPPESACPRMLRTPAARPAGSGAGLAGGRNRFRHPISGSMPSPASPGAVGRTCERSAAGRRRLCPSTQTVWAAGGWPAPERGRKSAVPAPRPVRILGPGLWTCPPMGPASG